MIAGYLFAHASLIDVPFYLAGGLKIGYDLLLFKAFKARRADRVQGDHESAGGS